MKFQRSGGILVHPTSFPSRFGIGDLGQGAFEFLDFLADAGLGLWQVLPLGPTGYGDSPYQSFSAFAGNPLLISLEKLIEEGLLRSTDLDGAPSFSNDSVDFGRVIPFKLALLMRAFQAFREGSGSLSRVEYEQFCLDNADWLDDYALFIALKEQHAEVDGGVWTSWPREIAFREPSAMEEWQNHLSDSIELQCFQQFLFFKQWLELKQKAKQLDIKIIGDVPIFVAHDSADVWSRPHYYHLDAAGRSTVIAGVPPDYFSKTGQRWGNPLYRWEVIAADNYHWWVRRLAATLKAVDIVRIDHFRGFEAYWEIPGDRPTAEVGRWVKGPGAEFFEQLVDQLGDLPIIAEDLGFITKSVLKLRDDFQLPGMKILQFAWGAGSSNDSLPHNHVENCVVYSGTHDNETTAGWYENAPDNVKKHFRSYAGQDGTDPAGQMARLAFSSVAHTAIVPLQDILRLGNEARMNLPGETGGYWRWRYRQEMLTDDLAAEIREYARLYGRESGEEQEVVRFDAV